MPGGRVPATGEVVQSRGAQAAVAANTTLYVNRVGDDGWLQALDSDGSTRLSLCKYTRVKVTKVTGGRTYFKVEDGTHTGKTLSLVDANAGLYLGSKAPAASSAKVTITYAKYTPGWISAARNGQALDQQMALLELGALKVKVTMNTVWNGTFYPLPAGNYTILLPDVPHAGDMTRFYRRTEPSLKHDQVWFPIKFGDNSRYVHVGNVSDGCATVLDLALWDDLHEALVSHRGPDGKSVGELTVKGKPERAK